MHHSPAKADFAAFILAGGKSTRMGADKAFVTLNGRTLLERALDLTQTLTTDVTIVGAAPKFQPFGPVVEDIFPNCGPLGGIHAALRASTAELNLRLAVDLPFVPATLLRFLIVHAEKMRDSMAIVPRTREGWQPLCAIYRREFADAAETALRTGNYRIDALFSQINVQTVKEPELAELGFSSQVFCNLNTQTELTAAGAAFAGNQLTSDAAKR
jgi:molybdopterin-guanine dinucleotide biosynthesis protein A